MCRVELKLVSFSVRRNRGSEKEISCERRCAENSERCTDASFADNDSFKKTIVRKREHKVFLHTRHVHVLRAPPARVAEAKGSGISSVNQTPCTRTHQLDEAGISFSMHVVRKAWTALKPREILTRSFNAAKTPLRNPAKRSQQNQPTRDSMKQIHASSVERHQSLDRPSQKMRSLTKPTYPFQASKQSTEKLARTSAMRLRNFFGRVQLESSRICLKFYAPTS